MSNKEKIYIYIIEIHFELETSLFKEFKYSNKIIDIPALPI